MIKRIGIYSEIRRSLIGLENAPDPKNDTLGGLSGLKTDVIRFGELELQAEQATVFIYPVTEWL
jgi:hypothetical protein